MRRWKAAALVSLICSSLLSVWMCQEGLLLGHRLGPALTPLRRPPRTLDARIARLAQCKPRPGGRGHPGKGFRPAGETRARSGRGGSQPTLTREGVAGCTWDAEPLSFGGMAFLLFLFYLTQSHVASCLLTPLSSAHTSTTDKCGVGDNGSHQDAGTRVWVSSTQDGARAGRTSALATQSHVSFFPPQIALCCRAPPTRWSFENFLPGLPASRDRAVERVPGVGVRDRARGRAGCVSSRCA